MPILTAAQKAMLRNRLGQPDTVNLSDADAAAALSARTMVPNPAAQGTATRPFQSSDVLALIAAASLGKALARPSFEAIRVLMDAPDPKAAADLAELCKWSAALLKAGDLTQADYDALMAPAPAGFPPTTAGAATGLFRQTQPDPAWPAQVAQPSWAQANFGGVPFTQPDGSILTDQVSTAMVTEARQP